MTRTRGKEETADARDFGDRPEEADSLRECSICGAPFDLDAEGGSEGHIGLIPVAFCPPCKAGIYDYVKGTEDDDQENSHVFHGIPPTD